MSQISIPVTYHQIDHHTSLPSKKAITAQIPEKLNLKNGDQCRVVAGTHKGKAGKVADINTSKTGNITITVVQKRR